MFSPIKSLVNRLMNYGVLPGMDQWDTRRTRLLNFFYGLATITYFTGTIETYWFDGAEEGNWVLAFLLVFQLGLIPLLMKKRMIAESFFLLMGNATLFFFDNHYGKAGGTWLYYFPFITVIAFLVDFRKTLPAVLHLLATLLFIVAGFVFEGKLFYRSFPEPELKTSFIFSFLISAFTMASITLVIVQLIYGQYRHFLQRMEERRQTEASMKAALREKETLLAEVHHRVKNNLAVISSLLNLQMNTVSNEYTRNVLRESRNRVASMALIHQRLYNTPNADEIDFGQYASGLVEEIRHSYIDSVSGTVLVKVNAESCLLQLTQAIPCGLVLNELLSNCYKHAFPGGQGGTIWISSGKTSGGTGFFLQVEDNGIGIPAGIDGSTSESLGLTIIQSLTGQVEANYELKRRAEGGTYFRMEFQRGRSK